MASIGIFDSGYGGLTIFKSIVNLLPQYNYIYLGDNARAPYGNRDFETVYQFTLQAVKWLFEQDCDLVILACNTASAKALRSIQQKDLIHFNSNKRVLGVIRPTAEVLANYSKTKHVGILGTLGTVRSQSYLIEIAHFAPEIKVVQHACPLWVPLIEAHQHKSTEALEVFRNDIETLFKEDSQIDTLLLACTHYPLVKNIIQKFVPENVTIVSQDELVANSLNDYLKRHAEMEGQMDRNGKQLFFTTGDTADFEAHTQLFFGKEIKAYKAEL